MYKKLQQYSMSLEAEFDRITGQRKAQLEEIGAYIIKKNQINTPVHLTVICTHNSRRSHIGQVFLKLAAVYYGIENVHTFSGGTEATAFYPSAVEALSKVGFEILKSDNTDNPVYTVKYDETASAMQLFSKKYSHAANPKTSFAAIMVCSEADGACPFVSGADARFAIPYQDPKQADNTPLEAKAYSDKCREIGREMFFVVNYARQNNT